MVPLTFRIAMAQVGSTAHKEENLEKARVYMRRAKEQGADIVVFPEVFMSHFGNDVDLRVSHADAEAVDGPFALQMSLLSRENGLWSVFGMRERAPGESLRSYNTTLLVDARGQTVGAYRKTHLYDAFGAQESLRIAPGDDLFQPVETPFGRIGMFVCYELRFPEIAREQVARGAEVLIVPSGWVRGSMKEDHWETLVTARALENTVFVVAADQISDYYCGRSLVVDPMGVRMISGGEEEQLLVTDIDVSRIAAVRSKLPSYRHRRPELYTSLREGARAPTHTD